MSSEQTLKSFGSGTMCYSLPHTHTECVLVNFPLLDQMFVNISIYNAKSFTLEVKTMTDLVLWPEYVV